MKRLALDIETYHHACLRDALQQGEMATIYRMFTKELVSNIQKDDGFVQSLLSGRCQIEFGTNSEGES